VNAILAESRQNKFFLILEKKNHWGKFLRVEYITIAKIKALKYEE